MTSTTLPQTVRTQAFIDGQFVDALDRATFESLAPATGRVIAEVAACGEADVDRAVRSARAAFNRGDWSRMAPADRKNAMLAFADLIDANREELALTEAIDAGKPITDCRDFDLPDVLGTIRWYAETADKVFGKTAPADADHVGLIIREPVGVVGGVLPWNFPMAMLAWKIGPALATGNSVVIKPPELASLTTLRLAELAVQAGLPHGVLNVVPGLDREFGQAQRGQRGQFRRFDDDRVAGRQGWPDFPREHRHRGVPRQDPADHADGLTDDQPHVVRVRWCRLAEHLVSGLGVPADGAQHVGEVEVPAVCDRLTGIDRLGER